MGQSCASLLSPGKSLILRMATASGVTLVQLFEQSKNDHYLELARSMHHLVLYSTEELLVLQKRDLIWVPPDPIPHNITYLLSVVKSGGTAEKVAQGQMMREASTSEDKESDEENIEGDGAEEEGPGETISTATKEARTPTPTAQEFVISNFHVLLGWVVLPF